MHDKSLEDIETSIESLDLQDQVRLLEFLAQKIANAVLKPAAGDADQAWRLYRAVGERLAATSIAGSASLTDAVSQSRR